MPIVFSIVRAFCESPRQHVANFEGPREFTHRPDATIAQQQEDDRLLQGSLAHYLS